jgi:signal transduction histidine kinase/CheY-like chemotaxis protein
MFFIHPHSPFNRATEANRMGNPPTFFKRLSKNEPILRRTLIAIDCIALAGLIYSIPNFSFPEIGLIGGLLLLNLAFLLGVLSKPTLEATRPLNESDTEKKLNSMAYWEMDIITQQVRLSAEAKRLLSAHSLPDFVSIEQFLALVHPEDVPALQNALKEARQNGSKFQLELRINQLTPHSPYILIKGIAERNQGETTAVSGILVDIEAIKRRESELDQARQAAETISQSKSEFLSSMSHEIRTPMNAIIGLTDMLLQEELKPQVIEHLRMIKYSSDNLLALINDILDLSKIEADKITFEQLEFDLYRQMHDLCNSMGFKAREKGLRLNCYLPDGLPKVLIGDPYRLNQMLFNLTSNAIKFTHEGEVNIRVAAAEAQAEENTIALQFSVEDTGIGIPEEKLNTIFERFEQASSDTTRQYGGTGLGLAITKKLVELQNGRINASSLEGKGSVFTLELSFQISKKTALAEPPSHSANQEKDLTGVRLLMIEDNVLNQIVAKRLLSRWKAHIDIANEGNEALNLLRQHHYDVILMDIHLPVMNGFEITKLIRSGKSTVLNPDIPIIALTADAFPETREKTRQAGMNDWVVKPFDQDQFFEAILNNLPVTQLKDKKQEVIVPK